MAESNFFNDQDPSKFNKVIKQIVIDIIESYRVEQIFEKKLHDFCDLIHANAATIVLWQEKIGYFNVTYNISSEIELKGTIINPNEGGLDGKIYRENQYAYLASYSKNMDALPKLKPLNFQYGMGLPLIIKDQLIATICFYYNNRREKLSVEEEAILKDIGQQIAVAIVYTQLEQKLKDKTIDFEKVNDFLELLLNSSRDIIINFDLIGKIKYWNKAAELSTGYTAKELINTKLQLINSDEELKFLKLFSETRRGNAIFEMSIEIKSKKTEKNSVVILFSLVPVRNQKDEIESILMTGQDITEKQQLISKMKEVHSALSKKTLELQVSKDSLKQTEEQLVIAKKLAIIGQLSEGLSHQINNPLMTVLNNIQIIEDEIKNSSDSQLPEKLLENIHDTIQESFRIQMILKGLKYFSTVTTDEHFRPTDLEEIINQTLQEYKTELSLEMIKIIKNINHEKMKTIRIPGNFMQLKHVIKTLFENAVLALKSTQNSKQEKILTIEMDNYYLEDLKYLRLTIQDNGIGIEKDQFNKIYQPFYTNWNKETLILKEGEIHIGLGLFTSNIILQNHHASCSFESEYTKGTSFIIDFSDTIE